MSDSLHHKYQQFSKQLKPLIPLLGKATDTLMDENISKYPILALHQLDELVLGIPLVPACDDFPYHIHLTTLEELSTKKIVDPTRINPFRQVYKDPQAHLCLFLLLEEAPSFVFLPRDTEE